MVTLHSKKGNRKESQVQGSFWTSYLDHMSRSGSFDSAETSLEELWEIFRKKHVFVTLQEEQSSSLAQPGKFSPQTRRVQPTQRDSHRRAP